MTEQGFADVFDSTVRGDALTQICRAHEPTARRARTRPTELLVRDLVYHQLQSDGTLAQHGAMLGGDPISDPAYAQRRELLPQVLFTALLAAGWGPLAQPDRHPDAFYRGWRLVGVDGTEASVTNTPGKKKLPKAGSRRGKAAFAKLKLVTAMELGLHNPLAAQTGTRRDYEVTLALQLWPRLPAHSLVIVDRLYGVAQHVGDIIAASAQRDLALLVRARGRVQARVQQRLADGSTLVQICPARRPGRPAGEPLTVREIRAELHVPGARQPVVVRLWTTLLDPVAYPAHELVELYAQRWEHELAYRETQTRRASRRRARQPYCTYGVTGTRRAGAGHGVRRARARRRHRGAGGARPTHQPAQAAARHPLAVGRLCLGRLHSHRETKDSHARRLFRQVATRGDPAPAPTAPLPARCAAAHMWVASTAATHRVRRCRRHQSRAAILQALWLG